MKFVKRIGGALAIGAAMMSGGGLPASLAQAAYSVTLQQQGSDVVATGTGTIDTTNLEPGPIYDGASASMSPTSGSILIGPLTPTDLAVLRNV